MTAILQDLLANPASFGVLLGLLTPLLTAVVQQPTWSKQVREAAAAVCATVVGLLTVAGTGAFNDGATISVTTVLAVVAASKIAYKTLWRKTTVTDKIEAATSPAPAPAGDSSTDAADPTDVPAADVPSDADVTAEVAQDPPTQ